MIKPILHHKMHYSTQKLQIKYITKKQSTSANNIYLYDIIYNSQQSILKPTATPSRNNARFASTTLSSNFYFENLFCKIFLPSGMYEYANMNIYVLLKNTSCGKRIQYKTTNIIQHNKNK